MLVADSFGLADEINLGAPVTHLAVNGEGMMAAVSGESGYRGAVTVFNRQREQAYKWYTSEYYIMCAALSPDGRQMAAGVFTQTGVELTGRLLVFRLDEEEPVADVPLGDTVPMQLAFQDNDTLIAVGDAGAAVVDVPDGSVTHTVSYATGELEGCSLTADGCLLAVHSYGGEAAQQLVLLTGEGESRLDLTRGGRFGGPLARVSGGAHRLPGDGVRPQLCPGVPAGAGERRAPAAPAGGRGGLRPVPGQRPGDHPLGGEYGGIACYFGMRRWPRWRCFT